MRKGVTDFRDLGHMLRMYTRLSLSASAAALRGPSFYTLNRLFTRLLPPLNHGESMRRYVHDEHTRRQLR